MEIEQNDWCINARNRLVSWYSNKIFIFIQSRAERRRFFTSEYWIYLILLRVLNSGDLFSFDILMSQFKWIVQIVWLWRVCLRCFSVTNYSACLVKRMLSRRRETTTTTSVAIWISNWTTFQVVVLATCDTERWLTFDKQHAALEFLIVKIIIWIRCMSWCFWARCESRDSGHRTAKRLKKCEKASGGQMLWPSS